MFKIFDTCSVLIFKYFRKDNQKDEKKDNWSRLLELVSWFLVSPYDMHINKAGANSRVTYSVSVFNWNPNCEIIVNTKYKDTLLSALEECKIKLDAYIETKNKLGRLDASL